MKPWTVGNNHDESERLQRQVKAAAFTSSRGRDSEGARGELRKQPKNVERGFGGSLALAAQAVTARQAKLIGKVFKVIQFLSRFDRNLQSLRLHQATTVRCCPCLII